MGNISLLKKVVCAASTIQSAAMITSLSCCADKTDTKVLSSISFSLPQSSLEVKQGNQTKTSGCVQVECFDQYGQHLTANTDVIVDSTDNNGYGDIVWVDEEMKINVSGLANPGSYEFVLHAQDVSGKVKSQFKSFSVLIEQTEPEIVPPDNLEIETSGNSFFFTQGGSYITLKSIATREGYDEIDVDNNCYWRVISYWGPKQGDLNDKSLFYLKEYGPTCQITMSNDIDDTYIGEYSIEVFTKSISNPDLYVITTITINCVDGCSYVDETTGLSYSRTNVNETWGISKAENKTQTIWPEQVLNEIYGSKVTSIRENFAAISSMLVTVILPKWIETIEDSAFAEERSLYGLAMPGVKYVGNNAFYNCTHVSLFTTYQQPQLVHIGENSFYNCSKLKLSIQQPAITVDDCAFAKSGVDQIIFGSSIESIGSNVFDECSGLETIEILNEEPPLLSGPLFSTSTSLKQIKVPSKSLEKYKNTGIWANYADLMVGI